MRENKKQERGAHALVIYVYTYTCTFVNQLQLAPSFLQVMSHITLPWIGVIDDNMMGDAAEMRLPRHY